MRKTWRSPHHIRYFALAMAAVIGLLPPCAAIAAEENAANEESDEKSSVSGDDLDGETAVEYICAFEPLAEEDALLSCTEKPSLEELTDLLPETLLVWLEGEEESSELEVTWESEEDFEGTKSERYTFYPKWDETLYLLADSAEDEIEIPTVTVEVPVEKGMIPELEKAKSALREIIEKKSILALVYLCNEYEVKTEPSADADTVRTVVSGQSVQITDAELDASGNVWYQVLFYQNGEEYTGYIERGYLAASDEDFVQWTEEYIELPPAPRMMKARRAAASYPDVEQFPASYQNALYTLKAQHPNWIFVRMDTGVDWNTAIARELGDKSLVPSGSSGSWQNGVYGQGWSYASEGILKYYMDPRNFLTDPSVFQFEQLTYNDSYHTAAAVQEILKNSFMASGIPGDSRTYAQAFNAIGQSTGVSPFHLASRVLQEQGTKGTSALISGSYPGYEGYYNYFNVNASGKTNAEVVQNGLKKAKEQGWNTRYKSLSGGAYLIGKNYILKGQDTLYLEKFNVSNGYHSNFTHQYMQNIQAPNSEASNIRKAYNNAGALENSFVFKIPVYRNMPASPCTKPNTTDVITFDKTAINSLEVGKTVVLTPCVNGSKVDYISNMTFSSDDPSVATVDSAGKVTAVSPGSAVISCTRSGAGSAICTVTVVKAQPNVSTPTLSPCTYREGLQLSDISLPDGWTWVKENTKIEAGTHSYEALYTPSDTVKYNTVTRNISFRVNKGIPICVMPEEPRVFAGTTLGEIALPKAFAWESDTEIVLQEPGEYTYYVTYNPDENNYHAVEHIPFIIQVVGESSGSDEGDDTPGGTTSSGSTGTGGNTGSGSGTGTGGNAGSGSGTGTGGNTGSGSDTTSSGTTSSGSTGTGGNTGSGSDTTSSGTTSSGSTGTGGNTGSGSDTTSSGSTGTNSNTGSDATSGSTVSNGSSASAGTSNAGAPLKELPKHSSSNKDKKPDSPSGSSQSTSNETGNSQSAPSGTDNSQPAPNDAGNGQAAQNGADNSQPAPNDAGNGQAAQNGADSIQPTTNRQNSGQAAQNETANSQSTVKTTGKNPGVQVDRKEAGEEEGTEADSQTAATEGTQAQESEESVSKPAVTMVMEDTTILTSENLQMAKNQNLDLLLKMGKYATWSIDIDSVDMDAVSEVDMGIELGTENVPTQIIADILDGNKYLEFTLAHDGPFGFNSLLQIAIDPMYEGWYANLFYYNEEAESLEFICDVIIDSNGIASFDMEHASSYVIIVSPTSMAGMATADSAVTGDTGSHAMRWIVIVVTVCMIAAGVGCGIFFYRKKLREEDDEEENEEPEEEEYEEPEEEEYEEPEEEYEEPEEEVHGKEIEETYGHGAEDDWIEDEDWQEPETPEEASADRFADDHAEDDWIEDDEWDIGNDWIDDEEWARRKEA